VLVHYQDKKYYEHSHEHIRIRQNEVINEIKSLFQKSISEIYLEVSKKKNDEIENFLNLNIKAVNVKLNILKNDFYIENEKSRYCAILYDDADSETLETFFSKRDYSSTTTNVEVKSIIQRLNSDNRKNILPITESDFFIEFHLQRFKLLSFLPFKLFQIAHRFIVELEKIKELSPVGKLNKAKLNIEQSQPISTMNKKDTYFDKFCELIDNYTILKKSTAIGVMLDLEDCIKKIKSETLLELQNKTDNRDDYLDYLINEIEKQSYLKNANISYVQKWLDEYKISIEDIFNRDFQNNSIEAVIDRHYNDMDKFSPEKDKAHSVQLDFYQYICKHYADELITFFENKKNNKGVNKTENNDLTDNTNQLSVNQAIILLDKLGVFTDKTFENVPNTKKAKILSQLLGRNEKNIKTAIEKLELKQSELGAGYQRDFDKIQKILDNLE
jgi:hypothetical protein